MALVLAVACAATLAAGRGPHHTMAAEVHPDRLPTVQANDNRAPAGALAHGVLTVRLRAGLGAWRPRAESGPALRIEAFGEGSSPLSVPAPLIRVPAGTVIAVTIRNDLDDPLRVHGLCERSGGACPSIDVAAGETQHVQFKAGHVGTYHYWATTTGMPLNFRATGDSQLSGAFVVDPPGVRSEDRIFVITEWTSLTPAQLREIGAQSDPGAAFLKLRPDVLFAINGRAWPHTERLQYELEQPVRWRVVNLSTQIHPMHLHGFYFKVDSQGDGNHDRLLDNRQKPTVVTQLMQPGSTISMTWKPERAGNWLFHCHVMTHVSPTLHVDGSPKSHDGHGSSHAHGSSHDPGAGMTGMVMGITVTGPEDGAHVSHEPARAARKLTLVMRSEPGRFGDAPAYGFVLEDGSTAAATRVPVPGPTLVLTRGEPVEITLVNRLPEGTAIHWHGMELESYYDGVHGWSGTGKRVTPLIEPGGSFVVRFTPPRTGTFMYHTHLHDNRQLTSGLYGPMLVVEPGHVFEAAKDHVAVLARGGPALDAPIVINNERQPQFVWTAGARHRLRLINITPGDTLVATLQTNEGPVTWRPLTKDGAPVPVDGPDAAPASQMIGVGETYDFEVETPADRRTLWLEIRTSGGKWLAQGRVIVKP